MCGTLYPEALGIEMNNQASHLMRAHRRTADALVRLVWLLHIDTSGASKDMPELHSTTMTAVLPRVASQTNVLIKRNEAYL